MKSEIHISFNAPLNDGDTEDKTIGCRANNPDICKNYMLPSVCAFCRDDKICTKPSRAWKKQFITLRGI